MSRFLVHFFPRVQFGDVVAIFYVELFAVAMKKKLHGMQPPLICVFYSFLSVCFRVRCRSFFFLGDRLDVD